MKLSVVIVNYNVKYYVEQCLTSVSRATKNVETEVFVVDNHSRDGSVEYLMGRFPNVHFIKCSHNIGFSKANNIAIRQSKGDYVLLLNPDTIVGEDVLKKCVDFMDNHKSAGGAGVRMLTAFGTSAMESRRGIPTPMVAFYKIIGLCNRYPKHKIWGKYYMGFLPWDEASQIEVVSGAFFLLRRAAIEAVGMLDEDFFMYGEDIDLSYRLLKGGWQNWYLPFTILHYKGESTQKSSFRYVHVFYDAMLIFFRKHYGNVSYLVSIPVKAAIYSKATIALVKMQAGRIRKNLGFTNRRRADEPCFIFIGGRSMLTACRQIACRNGLKDVAYIEGSSLNLPKGHLDSINDVQRSERVYAVYDVNSYSYHDVFELFSISPKSNVFIGTFDEFTGIIITPHEIYQ